MLNPERIMAVPRVIAAGLITGLLALSGCGEATMEVVPVTGKLTMDGEAFGPTSIMLSPTTDPDPKDPIKAHSAVGKVDQSGNVTFTTYDLGDGVAVGEYRVVVGMDFAEPPKPFPKIYRDGGSSPLLVKVEPGMENIEIKMDSKAGPPVPKMSLGRGGGQADMSAAASAVPGAGVKKAEE